MKHNNCYIYPKTVREAIDGARHYDTGKEKLPSVTTILSATQSEEKKESLAAWAARIGEEAAEKIKNEAAIRGTAMHKILEKYVLEEGYLDLTQVGQKAHNMAIRVIEQGLCITGRSARCTTQAYTQGRLIWLDYTKVMMPL